MAVAETGVPCLWGNQGVRLPLLLMRTQLRRNWLGKWRVGWRLVVWHGSGHVWPLQMLQGGEHQVRV